MSVDLPADITAGDWLLLSSKKYTGTITITFPSNNRFGVKINAKPGTYSAKEISCISDMLITTSRCTVQVNNDRKKYGDDCDYLLCEDGIKIPLRNDEQRQHMQMIIDKEKKKKETPKQQHLHSSSGSSGTSGTSHTMYTTPLMTKQQKGNGSSNSSNSKSSSKNTNLTIQAKDRHAAPTVRDTDICTAKKRTLKSSDSLQTSASHAKRANAETSSKPAVSASVEMSVDTVKSLLSSSPSGATILAAPASQLNKVGLDAYLVPVLPVVVTASTTTTPSITTAATPAIATSNNQSKTLFNKCDKKAFGALSRIERFNQVVDADASKPTSSSSRSRSSGSSSGIDGCNSLHKVTITYGSRGKHRYGNSSIFDSYFKTKSSTATNSVEPPHVADSQPFRTKGFGNLGNTCYLNAILQALLSLTGFINIITSIEWTRLLKSNPSTHDGVFAAFHALSSAAGRCTTNNNGLTEMKDAIERNCLLFEDQRQEDAHELLSALLSQIHEDSFLLIKSQYDSQASGSVSTTVSKDVMLSLPIVKYFHSEVTSSYRCCSCNSCKDDKVEMYTHFSIEMSNHVMDIPSAIQTYFGLEQRTILCDTCSVDTEFNVTSHISLIPNILVVHLKRFVVDTETNTNSKNCDSVDVPEIVSLSEVVDTSNTSCIDTVTDIIRAAAGVTYRLKCMVRHIGRSATGGHYITDICSSNSNSSSWQRCDDSLVKAITADKVFSDKETPYILFYCKV